MIDFTNKKIDVDELEKLSTHDLCRFPTKSGTLLEKWLKDNGISTFRAQWEGIKVVTGKFSNIELLDILTWAHENVNKECRKILDKRFYQDFSKVTDLLKELKYTTYIETKKTKKNKLFFERFKEDFRNNYYLQNTSGYGSLYSVSYVYINSLKKEIEEIERINKNDDEYLMNAAIISFIKQIVPIEEALNTISLCFGSHQKLRKEAKRLCYETLKNTKLNCTYEGHTDYECTGEYIVGKYRCECGARRIDVDFEEFFSKKSDGTYEYSIYPCTVGV